MDFHILIMIFLFLFYLSPELSASSEILRHAYKLNITKNPFSFIDNVTVLYSESLFVSQYEEVSQWEQSALTLGSQAPSAHPAIWEIQREAKNKKKLKVYNHK